MLMCWKVCLHVREQPLTSTVNHNSDHASTAASASSKQDNYRDVRSHGHSSAGSGSGSTATNSNSSSARSTALPMMASPHAYQNVNSSHTSIASSSPSPSHHDPLNTHPHKKISPSHQHHVSPSHQAQHQHQHQAQHHGRRKYEYHDECLYTHQSPQGGAIRQCPSSFLHSQTIVCAHSHALARVQKHNRCNSKCKCSGTFTFDQHGGIHDSSQCTIFAFAKSENTTIILG